MARFRSGIFRAIPMYGRYKLASYGGTPEVMADAIINEWIEMGRPDPGLGDLWLAKPNIANHPFKGAKAKPV
jgi:hypothetical protein